MRRLFLLPALAVVIAAPALAHHGWSGYDSSGTVTMQGPLTSVDYSSPHVRIGLQAQEQAMRIVLAPPSRMSRRGLPDGALTVGEEVSVEGYRNRSDPSELRAERITVKGETVELR